jgi:hypothetical protein
MKAQPAGQVPEFFVTGLGEIELMGSNARHILVSERLVGGKVILVPVVHIIMPNSAVPEGILKASKALAIALIGAEAHPYN